MKTINGNILFKAISSVYLGGLIKEAVVEIVDGFLYIDATDETNSLFISIEQKIDKIEDLELGITDLGLLIKILSSDDIQYELSEKNEKHWLFLKRKNKTKIKLLLSSIYDIKTRVQDKDFADKLLEQYESMLVLEKESIDELIELITLLKPTSLIIAIKDNKEVIISAGRTADKQFELNIGTIDLEPKEIEVYCPHFLAVLKHLKSEKEETEVQLLLKDNKYPITLYNGQIWAFSPIQDKTYDYQPNYNEDVPF